MKILSYYRRFAVGLFWASLLCCVSCNKNEVIESTVGAPEIFLDSETGVYSVKVGHTLTISPDFENVADDDITWLMDDEVVARGPEWESEWPVEGTFYATIEAKNQRATVSEDIRIDVLDVAPPVISLVVPLGGFKVAPSDQLFLAPEYQNADGDDFNVAWYVDGEKVADTPDYTFCRDNEAVYQLRIEAENADGIAAKEFKVTVGETDGRELLFVPFGYGEPCSEIYTFAGRTVTLAPFVKGFDNPDFSWTIDDRKVDCISSVFSFEPPSAGRYVVRVTVDEVKSAEIAVVCVQSSESGRKRPATSASSAVATKVFDWIPGPGQFINETTSVGGMTGTETSPELACSWAEKRLAEGSFVSLGAFGGYIIVGFDHSVMASSADYDFTIVGNAFVDKQSGSNEPGIVWVMQDVNGNGLPDDQWFELRGSIDDTGAAMRNYAVTFYRPDAVNSDVNWQTCDGRQGKVLCLTQYHKQAYYYPAWVRPDEYTLYGTLLPSNNSQSSTTGQWINAPFAWGYADNVGSDCLTDKPTSDSGQLTGFKISNAVDAAGNPVRLEYIDFIKVQTGILANSGILGEVSTEVCGFADYSMTK